MELIDIVTPGHSALILVDFQNDFCHPEGVFAKSQGSKLDMSLKNRALENTQKLLKVARKKRMLVIFLKASHNKWTSSPSWLRQRKDRPAPCETGTWGEQFYGVKPLKGECVVVKHRYSGFIGTDLDLILRSQGIKTLILTGGGTHACVESTARDGFMMDYDIVVLSDCTSTFNLQQHETALDVMGNLFATIVTSKEIFNAWSK